MIIAEIGPIAAWWGPPREGSPEHEDYKDWREAVFETCVEHGHLVYRPDRAFGGAWVPRAQVVNDSIIRTADAAVCIKPDGVPALGTDEELKLCAELGVRVIYAPPPPLGASMEEWERRLLELVEQIGTDEEGLRLYYSSYEEGHG